MYVDTDTQLWGVYNDETFSDGSWKQWGYLLRLANKSNAYLCDKNGGQQCRVKPQGSSSWLDPDDPTVRNYGSVSTRVAGCGTALRDGAYTRYDNHTKDSEVEITYASELTTSMETEIGNKITWGVEVEGGKEDVFKVAGKFEHEHEWVTTQATDRSSSVETSISVPPRRYFMVSWTETVFDIEGDWLYQQNRGALKGWQSHVASTYPARIDDAEGQTSAAIITRTPKSCTAGPEAENTARPALAAALSDCGSPTLPEARVGNVVHACPGEWDIPKPQSGGSGEPRFHYQWYYLDNDGQAHDIPSATGSSFTLQEESFLPAHTFLGVSVEELGDAYRLESEDVRAAKTLDLRPGRGLTSTDDAVWPSFAGATLPQAHLGEPVDISLLADADLEGSPADGSGVDLALEGELPPGVSMSEQGDLSGTPTAEGSYTFTLTDGDEDGASQEFTLVVHGPSVVFTDGPALTAEVVVGEPVSVELVEAAAEGMTLEVTDGVLPEGLSLDPSTGVISGETTQLGTSTVTVADTADALSPVISVSVSVGHSATTFRTADLQDAQAEDEDDASAETAAGAPGELVGAAGAPGAPSAAGAAGPAGQPLAAGGTSSRLVGVGLPATGAPASGSGDGADAESEGEVDGTEDDTQLGTAAGPPKELPAGRVGKEYSTALVQEAGSGAIIGLAHDGSADLAGLRINAETGELSGVPDTPGQHVFTVTDLAIPQHPTQSYVLQIDEESTTPWALITGVGGLLLGAAAATGLLLWRRTGAQPKPSA